MTWPHEDDEPWARPRADGRKSPSRPLRVLIFAKAPVPGQVKTRLAPLVGDRGAARLYRGLVEQMLDVALRARIGTVELWCAPTIKHPFFFACRRRFDVRLRRQCAGDLGERMDHAIRRTVAQGCAALLVGGDVPSVTVEDLRRTDRLLREGAPVVVGPAEDGGYVLIAMARAHRALFRGIAWGGADVLARTRARLVREGLEWVELPLRWDVDRPEDLRRWRRALARQAAWPAAPRADGDLGRHR